MQENHAYRDRTPTLTIKIVSSAKLGTCYYSTTYRVTSKAVRLSAEKLAQLSRAGVLGQGQEFRVLSQCDGQEVPNAYDKVACTVTEDGGACQNPQHKWFEVPYYSYDCERRVDSSG